MVKGTRDITFSNAPEYLSLDYETERRLLKASYGYIIKFESGIINNKINHGKFLEKRVYNGRIPTTETLMVSHRLNPKPYQRLGLELFFKSAQHLLLEGDDLNSRTDCSTDSSLILFQDEDQKNVYYLKSRCELALMQDSKLIKNSDESHLRLYKHECDNETFIYYYFNDNKFFIDLDDFEIEMEIEELFDRFSSPTIETNLLENNSLTRNQRKLCEGILRETSQKMHTLGPEKHLIFNQILLEKFNFICNELKGNNAYSSASLLENENILLACEQILLETQKNGHIKRVNLNEFLSENELELSCQHFTIETKDLLISDNPEKINDWLIEQGAKVTPLLLQKPQVIFKNSDDFLNEMQDEENIQTIQWNFFKEIHKNQVESTTEIEVDYDTKTSKNQSNANN
ncbi:MAG: hypothetical protein HYX60_01025 [Legionella longbeachae]|nr:hypothetical protein [Legionella longbeachae]